MPSKHVQKCSTWAKQNMENEVITSDIAPVSSKGFLDIQANIESGFTLKCVRDMTRTYSQLS